MATLINQWRYAQWRCLCKWVMCVCGANVEQIMKARTEPHSGSPVKPVLHFCPKHLGWICSNIALGVNSPATLTKSLSTFVNTRTWFRPRCITNTYRWPFHSSHLVICFHQSPIITKHHQFPHKHRFTKIRPLSCFHAAVPVVRSHPTHPWSQEAALPVHLTWQTGCGTI